jgi:hypothetical protein
MIGIPIINYSIFDYGIDTCMFLILTVNQDSGFTTTVHRRFPIGKDIIETNFPAVMITTFRQIYEGLYLFPPNQKLTPSFGYSIFK